jgi:proline iminopeptidase
MAITAPVGGDLLVNRGMEKMTMQEGFIEVPGGRVWYGIAGEGAPGIPLLVLHGGPGAPHDYLEPIAALAGRRPVVFYDQLGCGNSDKPDNVALWTVERFVEELACLRAALKLDRVHVLGQSWGSMLAVDYLLRKSPSGVLSLVLSGPFLNAPRFAADQRRYVEQMPADVRNTILESETRGDYESEAYQEAMIAYYRRHVCRLDPWPESVNRTFEKMGVQVYRHMWGPSEFTVTGTLKDCDLTGDLRKIGIPVLFTCGRCDEATPEATEDLLLNLPGSEMIIFEEASHMHHLEKPRAYLGAISDFMHRAEEKAMERERAADG